MSSIKSKVRALGSWTLMAFVACASMVPSEPANATSTRTVVQSSGTPLRSYSPYGDANQEHFSIWCQVYTCLLYTDVETGVSRGVAAESWEVISPTIWRFHLRKDLKRHDDGSPMTTRDIIHSVDRARNEPGSSQGYTVEFIEKIEAIDDYTFDVHTKEPYSSLPNYVFTRVPITSAEVFEKYGMDAYRDHPYGWGPYKAKRLVLDQEVVLESNPDYVGENPNRPQTVIYRLMNEDQQRITALLNGEITVATEVPPQLVANITNVPGIHIERIDGIEPIFLAMNMKMEPFKSNKALRKAIAYAIDRDAIIKGVLQDFAVRLDGPVGPGQVGYTPDLANKITFDPEKAKQYVKEANLPADFALDLYSPVNIYVNDRLVTAAIAQMLQNVGLKVNLHTPEWSGLWADIRAGKAPFYYIGRGGVLDPSEYLNQYFGTDITPRLGYSNTEFDEILRKERAAFDPAERNKWLKAAFEHLLEEVPAHFLWRYQSMYGVADWLDCKPTIGGTFWYAGCTVKE